MHEQQEHEDALHRAGAALGGELVRLTDRLREFIEQLEVSRRREESLARRLAEMEQENAQLRRSLEETGGADDPFAVDRQAFQQRFRQMEEQNANLINLYTASYQLHAALGSETVLQTIIEILVNLIGVEKLGVYRVSESQRELRLIASEGLDPRLFGSAAAPPGVIRRTVIEQGRAFFLPDSRTSNPTHPLAAIPMRIEGATFGLICVFQLLSHKDHFTSMDHELFEMLADHAAIALHRASRAETEIGPRDAAAAGGGRAPDGEPLIDRIMLT